ncbi:MAG: hypothetical protein ACRDIE_20670 [Chloroflexota bacterium]
MAIVVGFYRLSMYAVRSAELPEAFRRKQSHYELLPAALIRRLAVDSRFERRGRQAHRRHVAPDTYASSSFAL